MLSTNEITCAVTIFLTSCEGGREFAMTPISRVGGSAGLVVHSLFCGDVGRPGVLGADEFGIDKALSRCAKMSRGHVWIVVREDLLCDQSHKPGFVRGTEEKAGKVVAMRTFPSGGPAPGHRPKYSSAPEEWAQGKVAMDAMYDCDVKCHIHLDVPSKE